MAAVKMNCLSLKPWLLLVAVLGAVSVRAQGVPTPSVSELSHAVDAGLSRVEEFRFIQETAKRLGARVWLFGGTAAGYAHYAKWDLQRQKGDTRYQPQRFDYDYTHIFRSTQDADLVVDGTPEQAVALEQALKEKYGHLQGSKQIWEVRLLEQDRGDKQALLRNPDFLNQHTDSNSTGMIELTDPRPGETRIRDLRDWHNATPVFLEDIRQGKLHFYFSELHETTSRFKKGLNPPIVAAIRYLTKAFQYELEILPEDWSRIERIIRAFDPKRDLGESYVKNWLEKNGSKLIQHAVNIEYAVEQLDKLGLRQKLRAISPMTELNSLGWWMNKEPLRSAPVGKGAGRTAAELGLTLVTHETNGFLAYESLTRAHTGEPNVLISRKGYAGEGALSGDGHYTAVGKKGGRANGWSVRYKVDPKAREGSDFIRTNELRQQVEDGDYIVWLNRRGLEVIPESLEMGPTEYLEMILADRHGELARSNQGVLEKAKRRVRNKITREEVERMASLLRQVVNSDLTRSQAHVLETVTAAWMSLLENTPFLKEQNPLLGDLLEKMGNVDATLLWDQAWRKGYRTFKMNRAAAPTERGLPQVKPQAYLRAVSALMTRNMGAHSANVEIFNEVVSPRGASLTQRELDEMAGIVRNHYSTRRMGASWLLRDWMMLTKSHAAFSSYRDVAEDALSQMTPGDWSNTKQTNGAWVKEIFGPGWDGVRDIDAWRDLFFRGLIKAWPIHPELRAPLEKLLKEKRLASGEAVTPFLTDLLLSGTLNSTEIDLVESMLRGYRPEHPEEGTALRRLVRLERIAIAEKVEPSSPLWGLPATETAGLREYSDLLDHFSRRWKGAPPNNLTLLAADFGDFAWGSDLISRLIQLDESPMGPIAVLNRIRIAQHPDGERWMAEYFLSRERPTDSQVIQGMIGRAEAILLRGCPKKTDPVKCLIKRHEAEFYGNAKHSREVDAKVRAELERPAPRWRLLRRYFESGPKEVNPELLLRASETAHSEMAAFLVRTVSKKEWRTQPEAAKALVALSRARYDDGVVFRAFLEDVFGNPEIVSQLPVQEVFRNLLTHTRGEVQPPRMERWAGKLRRGLGSHLEDPSFIGMLIDLGVQQDWILSVLSEKRWEQRYEGVSLLLKLLNRPYDAQWSLKGDLPEAVVLTELRRKEKFLPLMERPAWIAHPESEAVLKKLKVDPKSSLPHDSRQVRMLKNAWRAAHPDPADVAAAPSDGCLKRSLNWLLRR
jgi:hypothetical protein